MASPRAGTQGCQGLLRIRSDAPGTSRAQARCSSMTINIGTAGWSIPRDVADRFLADGSALERYASRFPVAEINSSFHRSHRPSTWERWAESVPADFRFSVKVPKTITHQAK